MPEIRFQGNIFPFSVKKNAYSSYAVTFILCLVLVVLALLIDLFILLMPLVVALITVIIMTFEIPKYHRQYLVDEHAIFIQNQKGSIIKKIEIADIRYMKDSFKLPYGKYFAIFSKNSKENPDAQIKYELWFSCKEVICLPYTKELFDFICQQASEAFTASHALTLSSKTEFEGDIVEKTYQKNGRIAAVIWDAVVAVLCLVCFLSNIWVGIFISLFFLPLCIYIHIVNYSNQTRYHIDENGISVISKNGKIRDHIPLQSLSILMKADLRERPKPRSASFWGGTFLIFIPKGAEEELRFHDMTDEWLSVKNTICIPFSEEISDFIYQKTGIVMMMPK